MVLDTHYRVLFYIRKIKDVLDIDMREIIRYTRN